MNKKLIIIVAVVIVIAVVAWLVIKKPAILTGPSVGIGGAAGSPAGTPVEKSGLGGNLFDSVKQNPADNIPNTAPLQNNLNPYKGGYTNPF